MQPTLYVMNVSAFEHQPLFHRAYSALDSARREKIDRFRQESDQRRALGAGILLKYALARAQIAPYQIVTDANGKPRLTDDKIYFNLSHSGEMVICAIAPFEVGCDIEQTKEPDLKIARRFFTEPEYREIALGDSRDRFYRYWTLKESFIKANGMGMHIPLNAFQIHLNDPITVSQNIDTRDYYFCEIDGIDGYRCAVCGLRDCKNIIRCVKTPQEILSEMML